MSKRTLLKNYQKPNYRIQKVVLHFDIQLDDVLVTSTLFVSSLEPDLKKIYLHGEHLDLLDISISSRALTKDQYTHDQFGLTIHNPENEFELTTQVRLVPSKNHSMMGLFKTGKHLCTQCEAEGFRKITFFNDRPDVLAVYSVTITADPKQYPILLSNGNLSTKTVENDGRLCVQWDDPWPKPSYLFALVAGTFEVVSDTHVRPDGSKVSLSLFVDQGDFNRAHFAMASLKKAMEWDEKVYGLICDLDVYNVVATHDFNMGAMENKGLNVFNSKYVLADKDTATDDDFFGIESVIGHEYFHNWTGNRVTCRDWFQLTLKEGLTVFRDQSFSRDSCRSILSRLNDIREILTHQFVEDSGPLSHPIQPQAYQQINNFYTSTIYEKGSEVIGMLHTLVGHKAFIQSVQYYLKTHDGTAATVEDFIAAFEHTADIDLGQFRRWYHQKGTPRLSVKSQYDARKKTVELVIRQEAPTVAEDDSHDLYDFPVSIAVLGDNTLQSFEHNGKKKTDEILRIQKKEQTFLLKKVKEEPVITVNRGFTAPIDCMNVYNISENLKILNGETDVYTKWKALDALQQHFITHPDANPNDLFQLLESKISDSINNGEMMSLLLSLPTHRECCFIGNNDCFEIEKYRSDYQRKRALFLEETLVRRLSDFKTTDFVYSPEEKARRLGQGAILESLVATEKQEWRSLALDFYSDATNLTDRLNALRALNHFDSAERNTAVNHFRKTSHHVNLMNHWLRLEGSSFITGRLKTICSIVSERDFSIKNPNQVYSLLGCYVRNPVTIHREASLGSYQWMLETILKIDEENPQLASSLFRPMLNYTFVPSTCSQILSGAIGAMKQEKMSRDLSELYELFQTTEH